MTYPEDDLYDLPLLAGELSEKKSHLDDPAIPTWKLSAVKTSKQRRDLLITGVTSSLMTTLVMFGLFVAVYRYAQSRPLLWESSTGSQRPGTISCGTTMKEAISRGCIFDELSMTWMPQKCTQSYNDQYMAANDSGPFLYWVDRKGEQLLDDPSLHAGGGSTFWTSRRNHIVHCQYNLYRLADALKSGEYIGHEEGQSLSDHMHHCVMTMAEFALKAPAHDLNHIDVITEPGFSYC